MPDREEIEEKLRSLTPRECQVLYWICHGMMVKEVAHALGKSEQTIALDISRIYEIFDLKSVQDYRERRRLLESTIGPIQEQLIANPDVDCLDKLFQKGTPVPPAPGTSALVLSDLGRGLLPMGNKLAPRPQGPVIKIDPNSQALRPNRWGWLPWVIMILLVAVIAYLLGTRQNAGGPQPTGTVVSAVVTQTPFVITQAPQVITQTPVIITQPPPTPVPQTPIIQTAVVTVIPTASQTTAISSPTPTPIPSTPTTEPAIPAGQGYTKNGVTVTLGNSMGTFESKFGFTLTIENKSGHQITVLWKDSYFHARDDTGTEYLQTHRNNSDWDKNKQFIISNGDKHSITTVVGGLYYGNDDKFDDFEGGINPTAKYLIISLDQILGMQNLRWRYDLQ